MLGELTQWATPTGWGLVGMFVLLVATGRLVPIRTMTRELARADKETAGWKETAGLERQAREIQAMKDDEIIGLLKTLTFTQPGVSREANTGPAGPVVGPIA